MPVILTAVAAAQQPVTFDLNPMRAGGRTGKVSVTQGPDGLVITGTVNGGRAKFAANPAEMATGDHVEIWLAPPSPPVLPPIGWGNQFGMETEKSEKDCKELAGEAKELRECQAWFRAQPAYRARFRRLFVRQYQLAPGVTVESFAKAAWDEIQTKYTKTETAPLKPLAPSAAVQFHAENTAGGYTFEARVPWTAFPPMPSLRLDRLNIMVDIFSASPAGASSQPYSSMSANRKYGDVSTMNAVTLPVPRLYKITHCEYPLKARDAYFDEHPAWFLPAASDIVNEAFIVQNYTAGYQYAPGGLSPVVRPTKYSERQVDPGEYVCGPELAFNKAGKTTFFDAVMDDPDFQVKRLPDGSLLVKEGPVVSHSEFGSGACGACPHAVLDMHRITPDGKYELAFELNETVDGGTISDAEVEVSADWNRITVYRETQPEGKAARWSSETFCMAGTQFKPCGSKKNAPAPKERSLDLGVK
jgi:hypothetical protein